MITPYRPLRALRSADKGVLVKKGWKIGKKTGARAVSVCAPVLRNDIPQYVRDWMPVASFKKSLKTHYLKNVMNRLLSLLLLLIVLFLCSILVLYSENLYYTFEKRYYVSYHATPFVCVCVSVCHHVCGETAGLNNMASSEVNTI